MFVVCVFYCRRQRSYFAVCDKKYIRKKLPYAFFIIDGKEHTLPSVIKNIDGKDICSLHALPFVIKNADGKDLETDRACFK